MGCGASAARIPAVPPAGSAMAVIKRQKSLHRNGGELVEQRSSLKSAGSDTSNTSTDLSGDNESGDNVSNSSTPQILEENAAGDMIAADTDLTEAQGAPEAQYNNLSNSIAPLSLTEYAASATFASESDLKAALDSVPSATREKILETIGRVKASSALVVTTSAAGEIVKAADTSTPYPQTMAEFAMAAREASQNDLKSLFLGVPQEVREKLSESLAPLLVADEGIASKSDLPCMSQAPSTAEKFSEFIAPNSPAESSVSVKTVAEGDCQTPAPAKDLSEFLDPLSPSAASVQTASESDFEVEAQHHVRDVINAAANDEKTLNASHSTGVLVANDMSRHDAQSFGNVGASVARMTPIAEADAVKILAKGEDTGLAPSPVGTTPAKTTDMTAKAAFTAPCLTVAELAVAAQNASEEDLKNFLKGELKQKVAQALDRVNSQNQQ